MHYRWTIPLVAAAANGLLCLPVIRQGVRDRLHRTFAVMTLSIIAWNLDIFSLYFFKTATEAEVWSRAFRTGVCLAPVAAFHFALVMAGTERWPWTGLAVGGYVVSIVLIVLNLDGLLVKDVTPHAWGWYIEPTRLYSLFTATLVLFLALTVQRVWHGYRHASTARQRLQAKLWMIGAFVQIPLSLTNVLPIYGFNVFPLGNLANVFFVGIIAYAIVRHRLMDVDYVVRKFVSFALASTAVLLPGGMLLAALARAMGAEAPAVLACGAIGLALLAVILIPTLQEALETRVQRAFFPRYYDSRRQLQALAVSLVHVLDRNELVSRLGTALRDTLDVERCEVFIREEETPRLVAVFPDVSHPAPLVNADVRALEKLQDPVLASEVTLRHRELAPMFAERGWEVGIPLRIGDRLNGFIGLSQKKNYRIFSGEDLQLLATVAGGATVALENAHLSRQLRRSEAVLERANRLSSLGMLAAGIAHEIRNPLVAVKTFLDLLPQRLDDREFLTHFRDLSLSELRRVTDLIADLLTLGKSRTAERRSVELLATLEPVIRLMESTAKKRQIDVVVEGDASLPAISADPDQLKQIALNLILNAIESSPAGGRVTVDARAGARLGPSAAVVVEVRDQGPGIPPDQLENIFHPFFTTKETGTGLGLALVHQMVVDHGGEIAVDSVPGRGTTFRVTLPVAQAELRRTGT